MTATALKKATYDRGIYDIGNLEEAKGVILGPEPHESVDQRWERETPYLVNLIREHLSLVSSSWLLDYGCGVGRLSRELIQQTSCKAVGIDTSANMRALAANYVDSPNFMAAEPMMIGFFGPCRFDAAIAVWVLQHCLSPQESIAQIYYALKENALLFVLDDHRLVPTDCGFVNDGIRVSALLQSRFKLVREITLDPILGADLHLRSHCAVYRKAEP